VQETEFTCSLSLHCFVDTVDLLQELYGVNRVEAMALGSSVVDLTITQIVNGVKGVHACLPHGAIR